jgi:hypothetical protein
MFKYPHTADEQHKSFTDFSLKKDNDYTLSTRAVSEFEQTTDLYHLGYRPGSTNTYTGWDTGTDVTSSVFTFQSFPYASSSLFQEFADPTNEFQNVRWGNFWAPSGPLEYKSRAYKAPNTGLYTLDAGIGGTLFFDDTIPSLGLINGMNKGAKFSVELLRYTPDTTYLSGYSPYPEAIYETEQIFYEWAPQGGNFSAHISEAEYLTIASTLFDSINSYGIELFSGATGSFAQEVLPFSNINYNYNNVYDPSTYKFTAPGPGDYTFKCRFAGFVEQIAIHTSLYGLNNDQLITYSSQYRVKAKLRKQPAGQSIDNSVTLDTAEIVKNISYSTVWNGGYQPPGAYAATVGQLFETEHMFGDTTVTLAEGDRVYIGIEIEKIAGGDLVSAQLHGEPFGPTFFALESSAVGYESGDAIVHFNIQTGEQNFQLFENEIVVPRLKWYGINPDEVINTQGTNNQLQGMWIKKVRMEDEYTYLKKTFSCENVVTIGPHLAQDNKDGIDHYQPLKGSFYVDLSDVQASISHPVLVQVPLHGFSKYTELDEDLNVSSDNFNQPNSRRFLNNSLELNVSTFSNRVANRRRPDTPGAYYNHNSLLTGVKRATNVTYHANFVHYGSHFTELTYNSAPITRFDNWGQGFTVEDLISAPGNFVPDDDIVAIDDFDFLSSVLFGIYQGPNSIGGMPTGAEIAPRIRLVSEENLSKNKVTANLFTDVIYNSDHVNASSLIAAADNDLDRYTTGPLPLTMVKVEDEPWPYYADGSEINALGEGHLAVGDGPASDVLTSDNLNHEYNNWWNQGPYNVQATGNYYVDGPFDGEAIYRIEYTNYNPSASFDPPASYYSASYNGTYAFTYVFNVLVQGSDFANANNPADPFSSTDQIRAVIKKSPAGDPSNITTIGTGEWLSVDNLVYYYNDVLTINDGGYGGTVAGYGYTVSYGGTGGTPGGGGTGGGSLGGPGGGSVIQWDVTDLLTMLELGLDPSAYGFNAVNSVGGAAGVIADSNSNPNGFDLLTGPNVETYYNMEGLFDGYESNIPDTSPSTGTQPVATGAVPLIGVVIGEINKGDKIWIEIEVSENSGNIGQLQLTRAVVPEAQETADGMSFYLESGFTVYPPKRADNTIQPVYEFMVTSNTPNTIVKGTYNYY